MLPTREDAERLAEAFRGRDLLAMLEALQGFELKVEDMPLLDTDAVMVVATATMYVTSNVAQKLKAMNNDEANKFALPTNNLYQLLVDLINELQQRTVVQRMMMMRRDEIVTAEELLHLHGSDVRMSTGIQLASKGRARSKRRHAAWAVSSSRT